MQNKIFKILFLFLAPLLFLQAENVLAGACGGAASVTSYNGSVYLKACNQRAWGNTLKVCPNPGFPLPACTLKLCENEQESYVAQDNITVTKSTINGNLVDTLSWSCGATSCSVPYRTDYTACNAAPLAPVVNGTCGLANGQSVFSAPTTDLCATGTVGLVTDSGSNSWLWACNGSNGGTNAACYAYQKVNALCGPAATAYVYSATNFSGNYCNSGAANPASPAFPAPGASVSWICTGINGGTDIDCSASRAVEIINGACGTANGKIFSAAANGYGSDTQCARGTSNNTAFPAPGASVSWTCSGVNGGTTASCSASRVLIAACGTANNKTYLFTDNSYGADTQCASGTANNTAFPSPGQTVSWICSGANSGANASCSASRAIEIMNGVCGSANAQSFTSTPTAGLCSRGTASAVAYTGSNSWLWTCYGSNGGTNVGCYAYQKVNALCGPAATAYVYSATNFSGNYCNSGAANPASPAFPAPGASVSWTCSGVNGGTNSNCIALRAAPEQPKVNGACGTANGVAFAHTDTGYGSYTQCAYGSPSNTAFPAPGASVSWTCSGVNGGTVSPTCTASRDSVPVIVVNGKCGTANGQSFYSAPTTNLCAEGTAGALTYSSSNSWLWTCIGANGGTNVGCYAYQKLNGVCGTANGKEFAHTDTGYGSYTQCAYGSPSNTAFPAPGASVSWTCSGVNGGTVSPTCTASRNNPPQQIIDGVCGSAYGQSFTSAPTTGLCDAGTPSAITGTGPWSWSCEGVGEGSSSVWCSANVSY